MIAKFVIFSFVFCAIHVFASSLGPSDDDNEIVDIVFHKIGEYLHEPLKTVYYVPRHLEAVWSNARSICQSYGMDYMSLDSEDMYKEILEEFKKDAENLPQWLYIGAITKEPSSQNDWYSVSTGTRITFPLKWANGQPNNHPPGQEYCMTFEKQPNNSFLIHDCPCNANLGKFVCQKKYPFVWTH